MTEYEEWENEVVLIIQETLEISREDALIVIDSKPVTMMTSWHEGLMATEAFLAIMDNQHEN